MKVVRILFKDTKNIVTISLEQIAYGCKNNPTELEIMRTLKEMEIDNEIIIIQLRKNH